MPATVVVVNYSGAAPGTPTEVTSDRYNCSDQIDPNLQYANQVPGTGLTNNSWWKHRGLWIKAGSFSQLSEFRYGGPGNSNSAWGLGSGMIQVAVKDSPTDAGCPIAEYQQATGTSTTGVDIKAVSGGHAWYKDETAPCVDLDTLTEEFPLAFDSDVKTTTGYTKLIVSQLVLEDDTTFGEKAIIYEFWKWKEI